VRSAGEVRKPEFESVGVGVDGMRAFLGRAFLACRFSLVFAMAVEHSVGSMDVYWVLGRVVEALIELPLVRVLISCGVAFLARSTRRRIKPLHAQK
jgi:hypothetical protein